MEMTQPMRVLASSETNDWHTPREWIERAREVLGEIDLDPASCAAAQETVRARYWYGPGSPGNFPDGLAAPWFGRIFLNPPFGKVAGKSGAATWVRKLCEEWDEIGQIEAAILLVHTTCGYTWYEDLWRRFPVCLVRERISFLQPDGTRVGPAKRGQTFAYLGAHVNRFADVFRPHGRIFLPDGWH